MGLDMYAYTVPANAENEDFKFMLAEGQETSEISYWRKFNALHGWMEDLYRSLGGEDSFNCVPIKLTAERLDMLEAACSSKQLQPRQGFFFGGQDELDEEDYEAVEEFIAKARSCIASGKDVYYDSWW